MEKRISIAIDGWSACGKSTLAKDIAKSLNYIYIDSGAMYRSVALYAYRQGFASEEFVDAEKIIESLADIHVDFAFQEDGKSNIQLNGENVEGEIRSLLISNIVSPIAKIKEVRIHLVSLQRELAKKGGVVMEGRDIGSVVLPDAELKIFLTASPEVRAQRRFDELVSKGENPTMEEVVANLKLRDEMDATREESPLVQVEDAVVIDNSFLDKQAQLDKALNYVQVKIAELI